MLADNIEVEYEDLFSSVEKQRKAVKLASAIWKTREELLTDNSTNQCT